ncbi:MAG: hypothetical protein ACRDRU_15950 [Pseudonocardiaceae bacterium]
MPEDRGRPAVIRLDAGDAIELAQLLGFLGDWFDGHDAELLTASFSRFVGATGYELAELQADLARFASLLGADGEPLPRT